MGIVDCVLVQHEEDVEEVVDYVAKNVFKCASTKAGGAHGATQLEEHLRYRPKVT
jgi:hypothetical protein